MSTYVPGTLETDPKKLVMSLQQLGPKLDTNTAAIATLNAATYVNSIAGNSGSFTLNSTSGITNATNDIKLQQASASQFGAVKVDGTSIVAASGILSVSLSKITASLGVDLALNNSTYVDGPSVAQGNLGTWFVSGTVTVNDTAGVAQIAAKLWDGTTIIASTDSRVEANATAISLSLSGVITSPAGNLRISCLSNAATTSNFKFNFSGNSKDCTITAIRIA